MVSIIILTFQQLNYTKLCIRSILDNTDYIKTPYEIIVVDNNSTDGTRDYLDGLKQKGTIKTIYNKTNLGFPAGVNQGAKIATGDYLCLLNNDVLVSSGWLEKLLRGLKSDTKLAAVGAYTNHSAGFQQIKDAPQYTSYEDEKFQNQMSRINLVEKYTDLLIFFCVLIKRSVFDEFKGLDEDFTPGNWEDHWFCHQATKAGYKLKMVNCYVHHFCHRSWGGSKEKQREYRSLIAKNQKLFHRKVGDYKRISLCMIVADSERPETLKRCLDSVAEWVDEICIVFNYKWFKNKRRVEKKMHILKKYNYAYDKKLGWTLKGAINEHIEKGGTDIRYKYLKWIDFSDMRNKSLDMATGDYCLWVDADDVLQNAERMREVIQRFPDADCFKLQVKSFTHLHGAELILQNRLFKNKKGFFFRNKIHEDISFSMKENNAEIMVSDIVVHHEGNLSEKRFMQKNKRNYRLVLKEINKPDAHSLTYYAIINTLMIFGGKENNLKAMKYIDKAFKKFNLKMEDPLTSKLWVLRGLCCMNCGQLLAAKQSYHKAWDENKHFEAGLNLAEAYMQEKNIDKAIEILEEIYAKKELPIANIPYDFKAVEGLMLEKMGRCYEFKKDFKKAQQHYEECLSVSFQNLPVIDRLCNILRQSKRMDEATYITARAVNVFPTYAVGFFNLGQYELFSKRPNTARVFFQEAVKLNPKYKEAAHNLRVLEQMRKRSGKK